MTRISVTIASVFSLCNNIFPGRANPSLRVATLVPQLIDHVSDAVIIFIITSVSLYLISTNKDKSKPNVIIIRNILPSIVLSLLVFVIIKYRDASIFNPEPLMKGNYFD